METIQYFISALLALVGGAFSFYFYAVYKGRSVKNKIWVPTFCNMDSVQCTKIVDTKFGRIFGRTNAEIGGYFLLIYATVLFGVIFQIVPPMVPFIMGIVTIIFGIYLVYGLIKLKTPCPICITVHTLNIIIFLLQWI